MSLTPGTRLGAYEIVALIGAGGMGEVHRGRDTRLTREVAIKSIPRTRAVLRIGLPGNSNIAPKGDRFAIIVDATAGTETTGQGIEVVLNWFEELKQRVPSR